MIKFSKLKKWSIVEIEWLDSCHLSGWTRDNMEYNISDLEHNTVGYMLHETGYSITVVQSRKAKVKVEGTNIDSVMEIPKVAITKIRILK